MTTCTSYSTPKPDLRPAFPIPNLPLLLTRFSDLAEPFVSASLLSSYKSAVNTIFSSENAQHLLDTLEEKETNWSNAWFTNLLLSTRFAVATTARLSILINVPGASRENKLATLLRAVGLWGREYVFRAEKETSKYTAAQKLLEWQLRGLCGSFRIPKDPNTCMLKYVGPEEAQHAVIWCGGAAWKVQVIDRQGVVFSVDGIEQQILEILKFRAECQQNISPIPRIAALSWRLDRSEWHARKTAFEVVPENSAPLSTLYTSLVTVALEEYPAPTETSGRLNDVRMGETSENRFADQTLGIVSYPDGEMGLTFDHAPSDCGAAMELSAILLELMNSPPSAFSISKAAAPVSLKPLQFSPPQSPSGWQFPALLIESVARTVVAVSIYPTTPGVPRLHVKARLCDTVANLALQAAMYRATGTVPPISQPVQFKKFHMGRCDDMAPVSNESLAFVKLAFPEQPQKGDKKETTEELYNLFAAACKKRKEIISSTVDGTTTKFFRQGYVHPALLRMAEESPSEGLQAVLDVFEIVSGRIDGKGRVPSSLQFTGFTAPMDDIYAGLPNIFLPNQLVAFYLQKPNGTLTVSFSGTGIYLHGLESITHSYQESYEIIANIADGYVEHLTAVTPPPAIS